MPPITSMAQRDSILGKGGAFLQSLKDSLVELGSNKPQLSSVDFLTFNTRIELNLINKIFCNA